MDVTWKKAVLAVVCIAIMGFAGYRLWRSQRRAKITPEMAYRPRVCEACGQRSNGPTEPLVLECPLCHKKATVRVHAYVCRDCGTSFDAFRERVADLTITKMDTMNPPELVYMREGGTEWVSSLPELGEFKCPKCGSAKVGPPRPK